MNKKQSPYPEEFRKIVREAISDYRDVLGYNHYNGDIHYMDDDLQDKEGDVFAECRVDHRYLAADFKIYPCFLKEWETGKKDREGVREIIAHEVAHIATWPMFYMATAVYKDEGETKDAWESLTTVLGRLLYQNRKR